MRVLLIAPRSNGHQYSEVSVAGSGGLFTRVAAASLPTIAALAPTDFHITLCDETVQPIDFGAEVDVVGISMNVAQALRGIAIGKAFRDRGKVVVMGGPHVSLAPELFEGKADCLV